MQRGAIFDFNGTMVFDGPIQEESWRRWARHNLGLELTAEDFAKCLHGSSIGECLEYMMGRRPTTEETDAAEEERENTYRSLCLEHPEIYRLNPGFPELMDALVERGIAVNIASSSPLINMRFHFEQLGLDRWFSLDRIAYNDRTFPSKPAPDIFLRAADRMGLPAAACTVFEDAPVGLEAARRAGVAHIVAISAEYDRAFLEAKPGVELVIADYRDTEGLVGLIEAR